MDFFVGEDDEARQDAVGEDGVVVLEVEGLCGEVDVVGLFFGEEGGDEEVLGVGEGETELECAHEFEEAVMARFGVAIGGENAIEIGGGEDAASGGFELGVAEEAVDAAGDPVGVEDVGGLEDGVIAEVEDDAEVMEETDELVLVGFFGDAVLGAEGDVAFEADEVLIQGFEGLFEVEPALGEEVVDFAEIGDFLVDEGAEFFDALSGFAGGFEDGFDVGIFFLEGFAVEIEGLLVAFVTDEDDGGAVAEGLDELEPVVEAVFVFAGAAVGDEEVEAAFGEEELVGGVVDFLSAEVPDVEADVFGVDGLVPGGDVESVGLGFGGVVGIVDEAIDQGGFADAALTDEEDFGFVERTDIATPNLFDVVEDFGGMSRDTFWGT